MTVLSSAFPVSLSGPQIVGLWEQGRRLHPIDRALSLLSAAFPRSEWEELAALTIGERDAALLALRRELFGDRLPGDSRCPECGGRVEFEASIPELLAAASGNRGGSLRLPQGGSLEFRLPDSIDLALVVDAGSAEQGRRTLAERCITQGPDGDAGDAGSGVLTDEIIEALSEAMGGCDPLAEVQFDLCCPDCGHEWSVTLDILSYLWEELAREARRLLHDVHVIAGAYGWSEESILAMPAGRRRTYIDMIL